MYKSLESGLGSITVLFRWQSWSADQTWGLKSVLFNCLISSIILYWVYTRAIQIYYQYILIIGLYPFVHLFSGICIHICILGQILYPNAHSQIRFCIHILIPKLGSVSKYAFLGQALSIYAFQVMFSIHLYILRLCSVSGYIYILRLCSVSIYTSLGSVFKYASLYQVQNPFIHSQVLYLNMHSFFKFCIHSQILRLGYVSIYAFLFSSDSVSIFFVHYLYPQFIVILVHVHPYIFCVHPLYQYISFVHVLFTLMDQKFLFTVQC